MDRISQFEFCRDGLVVKFIPAPWEDGQREQEYHFFIEDKEELTQQVLNAVKKKRILERNFYFCAVGVFNKIIELKTGVNPSQTQGGKIKIFYNIIEKGDKEKFWKILLCHKRGVLKKNFCIHIENFYPNEPDRTYFIWSQIFVLGLTFEYEKFLKQFGTKFPLEMHKGNNKDLVNKFAKNCFFFTGKKRKRKKYN
jgi:hypothetical protein